MQSQPRDQTFGEQLSEAKRILEESMDVGQTLADYLQEHGTDSDDEFDDDYIFDGEYYCDTDDDGDDPDSSPSSGSSSSSHGNRYDDRENAYARTDVSDFLFEGGEQRVKYFTCLGFYHRTAIYNYLGDAKYELKIYHYNKRDGTPMKSGDLKVMSVQWYISCAYPVNYVPNLIAVFNGVIVFFYKQKH